MKSCAVSNLKKASLELGGKSPLIIFGDFDLDKAVRTTMGACFFNKGENCIAAGNGESDLKKNYPRVIVLNYYLYALCTIFMILLTFLDNSCNAYMLHASGLYYSHLYGLRA